jgi:transcriptional regulator with PAS, ATPase and Fis domain
LETQVLFVAPFEKLHKIAVQVVEEKFAAKKGRIRVIKGDLGESMPVVRQAVEDGIEVVVSRGGTAKLIAENVQVPVIPVRISIMDVIRMLSVHKDVYEKIGIAGFKNVIYGSEEIGKILGIELVEIPLQGEEEALQKLAAAKADGVQYIVGDSISVKIAKRLGLPGELIDSGREAIFTALKEAMLIAKIRREEQERSAMLRKVIDQSADGIVATDAAGQITMMNAQAEKIFKVSHFDALGKTIGQVFPVLQMASTKEDNGYFDDFHEIDQKTFTVKHSLLRIKEETIGELFNLQNVSRLQKIERSVRKKLHQKGLVAKQHMTDIVGKSAGCMEMKRKAAKYALTESTILITGASGTGKEVLVQSIHNASTRAEGPFVAVNCAALPENLLESELFGYEDGAFTGARRGGRQGLFELAHGGTLFLDEIGEMPMNLQSRLLRVLQEKEVMRLGGDSVVPVDVRIISATNRNLAQMVEQRLFREDLYYRLNILRIQMPTLAERAVDIPLLARSLMRSMQEVNPHIAGIEPEAADYLRSRAWPGNIRQLSNVIERAMLLSEGPQLTREDFLASIESSEEPVRMEKEQNGDGRDASIWPMASLAELEQEAMERILREEHFNYSRTAARLGIHRTTLWRRMHRAKQGK